MEIGQFWQVANFPARFKMADGMSKHANVALCRCNQTCEYFDHSTLTGTIGTQETKGLTALRDETDIIDRNEATICFT